MTAQLEVRLNSFTKDPVETIYAAWLTSRPYLNEKLIDMHKGYVTAEDVKTAVGRAEIITYEEVCAEVTKILHSQLPVLEFVSFSFSFKNMSVVLREQMVRSRQLSFWLTSTRVTDMSMFYYDGKYYTPNDIAKSGRKSTKDGDSSLLVYETTLSVIQDAYKRLVATGVPEEEARMIVPMCMVHSGGVSGNLRAWIDVLKKRSCWIAQATLWVPFIQGLAEGFAEADPLFAGMIQPPCKCDGRKCTYAHENDERTEGLQFNQAPCPLYWCAPTEPNAVHSEAILQTSIDEWVSSYSKDWEHLLKCFGSLWNSDPFTGESRA